MHFSTLITALAGLVAIVSSAATGKKHFDCEYTGVFPDDVFLIRGVCILFDPHCFDVLSAPFCMIINNRTDLQDWIRVRRRPLRNLRWRVENPFHRGQKTNNLRLSIPECRWISLSGKRKIQLSVWCEYCSQLIMAAWLVLMAGVV